MKKIWYFEEVDLFELLCPYKYAQHIEHNPLTTYHKNDFLFLPNEEVTTIYLIAEGKIKVGYYDEEGNEIIKTYLTRGEILGEMVFLGYHAHRDFAQALQDGTQVCKVNAEQVRELARSYLPFSQVIYKKIGDNIRKLERRLEILFFKDINRRLLELLKDFKEMYGTPCPHGKGILVEHALTQQEMANLIAASRKSVSLILNRLEREGGIELGQGKFWIKRPDFLP
jgi:CRP-like cAMP-binding protein